MTENRVTPIRVGVVGVGRGRTFMRTAQVTGMELVAICDTWEDKLTHEGEQLEVSTYTDYEEFLDHEMDAVVLANYFHEHAPFAIRALEKGKHVMSETAACHTLAEGVALARTVEKSNKIYFFAENYPYMAYNQEMRKLYKKGEIGTFRYGEGEYVHPDPADVILARSCGHNHWRNWIPATYYCTHSIAPVMYITDTRPVAVNGFAIPYDYQDPVVTETMRRGDTAAVIICKMNNDAVVKSLHGGLRGHGNYTRIHGNKGVMENTRHGDKQRLRVWYEPWEKRKSTPVETVYKPDFPLHHNEATHAGHGGGDFFTSYYFSKAIRTNEQPYLDVYRGIDMSIAGIQAWRSALNDSTSMEIPDFRKESVRLKYANDHWSPDPDRKNENQPLPSVLGNIEPTNSAKKRANRIWKNVGYEEP